MEKILKAPILTASQKAEKLKKARENKANKLNNIDAEAINYIEGVLTDYVRGNLTTEQFENALGDKKLKSGATFNQVMSGVLNLPKTQEILKKSIAKSHFKKIADSPEEIAHQIFLLADKRRKEYKQNRLSNFQGSEESFENVIDTPLYIQAEENYLDSFDEFSSFDGKEGFENEYFEGIFPLALGVGSKLAKKLAPIAKKGIQAIGKKIKEKALKMKEHQNEVANAEQNLNLVHARQSAIESGVNPVSAQLVAEKTANSTGKEIASTILTDVAEMLKGKDQSDKNKSDTTKYFIIGGFVIVIFILFFMNKE